MLMRSGRSSSLNGAAQVCIKFDTIMLHFNPYLFSTVSFEMDFFHYLIWRCPLLPKEMSVKNQRLANSVDSDEMVHYKLSNLDLHRLHKVETGVKESRTF